MHFRLVENMYWEVTLRSILLLLVPLSLIFAYHQNGFFIGIFAIYSLYNIDKVNWKGWLIKNGKYFALLIGYFILFLVSLLYTENLAEGWRDIESKLGFLFLPVFILFQKPFSRKELKFILLFYAGFMFLSSLTALIVGVIKLDYIPTNQELSGTIGSHASYLSLYCLLGLAAMIHFFTNLERRKWKLLGFAICLIQVFLLLLLASRIILLSMVLVALIWILVYKLNRKALVTLVSLLTLIILLGSQIEGVKSRFIDAVNFDDGIELGITEEEFKPGANYGGRALRIAIWRCSLDVIENHWLFGVGAGDVHQHLQSSFKENGFVFAWKYNYYNAHNLFIETLIAVGLPGLVLLIILFTYLLLGSLKEGNLILITFSIGYILLSLMESNFNVQKGQIFFLVFACLFVNSSFWGRGFD